MTMLFVPTMKESMVATALESCVAYMGQHKSEYPTTAMASVYSLSQQISATLVNGLAMYNALEIVVLVFMTFSRYRGTYFYSLLIASVGLVPYAIGNIVHFDGHDNITWFTMRVGGWWLMVVGQSMVLWSRLHLILSGKQGERILQWTKWMIVFTVPGLLIPTTVLAYGLNAGLAGFKPGYPVMEKVQITGFFIQELVLSSIYVYQAWQLLKESFNPRSRNILYQLLAVNVIIILLDMSLLVLQSVDLHQLQVSLKPAIYSIKLKLEFAVLGQLICLVGGTGSGSGSDPSRRSSTFVPFVTEKRDRGSRTVSDSIATFVDVEKTPSDFRRPSGTRTAHISLSDTDLIMPSAPRAGNIC